MTATGISSAVPCPQIDAIHAHLVWWFEKVTRGLVEVGWVPQGQTGITKFKRFTLDQVRSGEIAQFIADVNAVPGQNCYFRPALVAPPTEKPAKNDDFVESPGIWLDQDSPEQVRQGENVTSILQPQAWLITGRTPSLRKQGFLKADTPITDPKVLEDLNRRLRALYGGDPSVVNPTRLMRVPATVNWPVKKGRTVAEQTEPVYPQTAAPSYSLDQLQRLLPEEARPETKAEEGKNTLSDPSRLSVAELIRRLEDPAEPYWYPYARDLVAHWLGRNWSDVEILGWAERFTRPGFDVEQTTEDLQKLIDGARRKWNLPDQDHVATNPVAEAIKRFGENPLPDQQNQTLRPLTLSALLNRKFKVPEAILAPILPEGGAAMLHAYRGVGKTHVALAIACAVAAGGVALKWSAPRPRRVLVVDGEMRGAEIQERVKSILTGMNAVVHEDDFLQFLAADFFPEGLPPIDSETGRTLIEGVAADCKADLVILDNLSTLTSARENEGDDWTPVQRLILSLRRKGIASLIIHHSGKTGAQRGTSRREDILNTVIALKRGDGYSSEDGAAFDVHYEKARGFFGRDAAPFSAKLITDTSGATLWKIDELSEDDRAIAEKMFEAGESVASVLSAIPGAKKSTVYRWHREWKDRAAP